MSMNSNRPWYREPETFIALTALVVSLSAVAVAIYEAALQRAHDRAEVWPRVELATITTSSGAEVVLENTGIGPAVIKTVAITVDGKPASNWGSVLHALLDRDPLHTSTTVVEHGLRAGDKVTLMSIGAADVPSDFWKTAARVAASVCYASVFDEYWIMRENHLGGTSAWERVRDCPQPLAGTDF
jgi:hypothetical protein